MEWHKQLFLETEEVDVYIVSLDHLAIGSDNFGIANRLFMNEKKNPPSKLYSHPEVSFAFYKVKEEFEFNKFKLAHNNYSMLINTLGYLSSTLHSWTFNKEDNLITSLIPEDSIESDLKKNKIILKDKTQDLMKLALGRILRATEIGTKGKEFSEISNEIIQYIPSQTH